jgi:hypothetical protein
VSHTVIARISGNERVLTLLGALDAGGFPRAGIRVIESTELPEHGSDPVSTYGTLGGVLGGALGTALGWFAMSWSPMPLMGALWGLVVGALCGARWGTYAVGSRLTPAPSLTSTRIEIDSGGRSEAERAQRICTTHQAWEVIVTEAP